MTSKHTPGPWIARDHEDGDTGIITGARGEEIATCYKPDAPVIAAAPCLLTALKRFLACDAVKAATYNNAVQLAEAADAAHAIIDKAEGRA